MTKYEEIQKQFKELKKANSPWFTLDDGESALVTVRSMKAGEVDDLATGKPKAALLMRLDVDTTEGLKEKGWNPTSVKLIENIFKNEIDVGSSFVVEKNGTGFDTTYTISQVSHRAKPKEVATEEDLDEIAETI